ncbi:MAG: LLM class flavin-dependent oxidoreductase, partial [Candidatus Binatia bacterium]
EGKFYQFSLMTPFFSPGPIEWPKVPIYIAGVNPYVCRLGGELCDGFLVHPFHSIKYMRDVVLPNIEQGLGKSGRTRGDITLSTTAFVITGRARDEIERNKGSVRQQIAFYASTRTYVGVLEAHGWGETCIRLNEKAAKGDWTGMASLITDEMLTVYAVQGTVDELPDLIKKKYAGVMDRLGFYTLPGVLGDADERRALIRACRS